MASSLWTGVTSTVTFRAIECARSDSTVLVVMTRYRCNACGNLTRFDVVETTTVRSFHHYTVGGELTVEEPEVVRRSVDQIACRWCGHGRDVVALSDSDN